MKIKQINSIRVKFETLSSLKSEVLTFVPELQKDEINDEVYVTNILCLEREGKAFNVPPFMPPELLPGYLQSLFPHGRVITNPVKD